MKWAVCTGMILSIAFAITAQTPSVNSLGWMKGCWEVNDNGRVTTERWAAPTENLMIGTSQTVKNGKSVAGILEEETDREIMVKVGDKLSTIPKDQVVKRTNSPSGMPEMKYLLTKREIRDVVGFLATLKENE